MATFAAAEICDTNTTLVGSGGLRVLPPIFQVYGQSRAFSGRLTFLGGTGLDYTKWDYSLMFGRGKD